jgi:proteasome alpha subunit
LYLLKGVEMEIMPEKLGYDRTIVVFSPDGRLFQVEYATEAVKRGTTSLGVVFQDGVVLAAFRYVDKLSVINQKNEKIQQVDEHLGITSAGLSGDARVLIDRARVKAQVYRITYGEPIDTQSLIKFIADIKQWHTQYAGLRPMGISFLVAGPEPALFETEPSGAVYEWKAQAIGRGRDAAAKILVSRWREDLDEQKAIALALKALRAGEKEIEKRNIELAVIRKGKFYKLHGKDLMVALKSW